MNKYHILVNRGLALINYHLANKLNVSLSSLVCFILGGYVSEDE